MPELPEVETLMQAVRDTVLGKRFSEVEFYRSDLRWPIPVAEFIALILNQPIRRVWRRSKYLLLETELGVAIVHLGMSGNILLSQERQPSLKHTHASFVVFDESKYIGVLHFVDPRRFGALLCCSHEHFSQHPLLRNLGPEPLETEELADLLALRARRRMVPIKVFLMDAHNVVGVGNIYANEALYLAGIMPDRAAGSLSDQEWNTLVQSIQSVLKEAIRAGGTTLKDFKSMNGQSGYFARELGVYGCALQACGNCGSEIETLRLGGRATYFCRYCQK